VYIDARRPIQNDPTQEVVGWYLAIAEEFQANKGFVDSGGLGGPVLDVIRQKAKFQVIGVNSSSRAPEPGKYVNLRAYCWKRKEPVKVEAGYCLIKF